MESSPSPRCHHIRTSGLRCGSLAVRNRRYCYYHQRSRPLLLNFAQPAHTPVLMQLPVFEDAHAIQSTVRDVAYRLLDGTFSQKTAGLLLYALQIASSNLKHMKAETPDPEQVVVDLPKLSEIPQPTPIAESVPLNSHTASRTHFPDTPPSAIDDYRDDVKRQSREMREDLASQVRGEKSGSTFVNHEPDVLHGGDFDAADYHQKNVEEARRAAREVNRDEVNREREEANKTDDDLPPGTIHGRARRQRHGNWMREQLNTPSGGASTRP
jgi:hypothetical protein